MRLIIVALLLVVSTTISAETYLQLNGASIHNRPGFNSANYGAGLETELDKDWNIAGGWYRNSEYTGSWYGYGRYAVWKSGNWDFGIAIGAVTGYQRAQVMPLLFPELCYQYVCTLFIPQVDPNGASALGFHLKLPIAE